MPIPYKLSTDYVELFNLINSNNRIVAYYDRALENNVVSQDLVEVRMDNGVITAGVRGRSIIHIDEFSLQLARQNTISSKVISLADLFSLDCKSHNLQWLVP